MLQLLAPSGGLIRSLSPSVSSNPIADGIVDLSNFGPAGYKLQAPQSLSLYVETRYPQYLPTRCTFADVAALKDAVLQAHNGCAPTIRPHAAGTSNMTPTPPPQSDHSRADSLIEYPCRFPIKVMGERVEGFVHAVTTVAKAFDPALTPARSSFVKHKGGNYLGVTITITATSRAQLDELYRTLSTHPMVKVVL